MEDTFDLVWMQRMGGGSEVLKRGIPASEAMAALQQADRDPALQAPGAVCYLRPSDDVLAAVGEEVQRADRLHEPLNSAHEAYAVLLEELDEFKEQVWKKRKERDKAKMREELVQLSAMGVRAIRDLGL